jgi:hypothetical protein
LALAEKELQQVRKDNQVLSQYIAARRNEEGRKKEEEVVLLAAVPAEGVH